MTALAFVAIAWGRPGLPDFRDAVTEAQRSALSASLEAACPLVPLAQVHACSDDVDAIAARVDAWLKTVGPDAGIAYVGALAARYRGRDGEAERRYRQVIAWDPDDEAAHYDLGEILLSQGRLDEAAVAFARVVELRTEGAGAWVGPWRMAEVSAWRGDAAAMETHLREALRRGFSFRTVAGTPNWATFYANPALRDPLRKLVTVYGDPAILETWTPAP